MQTTAVAASSALAEGSFARQNYGPASVQHAAWPVRRRRVGTIEVLLVRGLVTAGAWSGIVGGAARAERKDRSIAAVALMAGAGIALDDAERMCEADAAQVRAGLLLNPRAFVVPPGNLPLFKRYAWLMAREGVGREAFSGAELPDALRWAQEMGLLMQADRRRPAACRGPRRAAE